MTLHTQPHYFLTGATGILGMEILARLLERAPGARVTCLIRACGDAEANARLAKVIHYALFWRPQLDFRRVTAVSGDITEQQLGIGNLRWSQLVKTVTHVIHSAASIQLGGEREAILRINTGGTRLVASFAMHCPLIKRFLLVSTAYVAGLRKERIREEELDLGQDFVNHYERSKLEAELFVQTLKDDLPVTVVRPSIIVGDSRDGHVHSFQNIYIPMYFFGTGVVEELPGNSATELDLVPVDYVADVVVQTLHSAACIGGTYHACSGFGRGVALGELMRAAQKSFGPSLQRPRLSRVKAVGKQMACFFEYLGHPRNFATEALDRDLGTAAPTRPDPESFLPKLMRFWRATDFGRDMPWSHQMTQIHGELRGLGRVAPLALSKQDELA